MALNLLAYIPQSIDEVWKARAEAIRAVKDLAIKLALVKDESKLVIRDVLPAEDLGRAQNNWIYDLSTTSNAEVDLINLAELHKQRVVAFYGVRIKNAKVSYIKFLAPDGSLKGIIATYVDGAYTEHDVILFRDEEADKYIVFLYEPEKPIKIKAYVVSGAADSEIQLLGVVADASGEIISP